ncbi:MAG: aminotransferase class IV family protein [Nitrospinae bacterium]|nr:aminotransferase class IV family protein [Nitrospinota bacterium]
MSVIVNGKETAEGFVTVADRGFALGDGLFETIPLYHGRPFLLEKHMERMKAGAGIIGIKLPVGQDEVAGAIARLAKVNGAGDLAVARLTVTRGSGPRGYNAAGCDKPTWTITVERYEPMPDEKRKLGLRLSISRYAKISGSPLNSVKSTSALDRVMTVTEARSAGADEAIVMSSDGHVASCGAANIFWVKNGKLYTPSQDAGALPGVTRWEVIRIAATMGIETVEGRFKLSKIEKADEIFIANSLIGIMPVREVDGIFAAEKPFTLTQTLAERYMGLARRQA